LRAIVDHRDEGPIIVCIGTPGGGLPASLNLNAALQRLAVPFATYNLARVASAANVLYVAGSPRLAAPDSLFLFHQPTPGEDGGHEWFPANAMRMTEIIEQRSGLAFEAVEELKTQELVVTAPDARQLGIVDEIGLLEIPPTATIVVPD
jgi:ATP-dependent Clp protease protease subunit